ncbi:MAG TPA: penicillin-binding protein [Bacteroidetes bacterium]|nr:penicillin-binding protein [Bacteroidota bacterium]
MENNKSLAEKPARKVEAKFIQDPKAYKKPRIFMVMRLLIAGVILAVSISVLLFIWNVSSDLPPMDVIENPRTELSTQIYTADGKLLRNLYSEEHRVSVKLNAISPHVLNALLAAEDIRFYQHSGIDPKAIFAILKDVAAGKKARGGSTITMQLARNLYDQVGRERSIIRKFKEMVVSVMIERSYTKEEIIGAYLNTVSFVGNTYGVQNGAIEYFRKNALDLEVQEAAMLVGLLKGTNQYNPRKHPKASLDRRNTILGQMKTYGFLEKAEADSLKALPLGLQQKSDYRNLGIAPYFTEHLRQWLKRWCKDEGYDLYRDGLRVYTTIDSRMQQYAEEAVKEHLSGMQPIFDKHIKNREPWRKDSTFLIRAMRKSYRYISAKKDGLTEKQILAEFKTEAKMDVFSWKGEIRDTMMTPWDSLKYYARFLETGFISIDPSNGHVKAWVGGINHKFFKYDHTYLGKRQVGSTFKPFVYTAAFDNGSSPCEIELNQPVFFYNEKGKMIWSPKNSDGKIGGYMTLRRGLATSTNMITARVMKRIGPHVVCEWAHKMGIKTELECVPSLALGTTDLSVFELTGAYCTFANRGIFNEPIFVTRIEDRNGNVLQEFTTESREAITEETAYMMLDMLKGVVREPGGTGGRIRARYKLLNEIGGKTGTTQNQSDGWFMGVTPHLVAGTWVGCSDRTMRFRSIRYGQGASLALPIFGLFMQKVYADSTIAMPKDAFPRPSKFDIELICEKFDYKRQNTWSDSLTPEFKSIMNVDDDF